MPSKVRTCLVLGAVAIAALSGCAYERYADAVAIQSRGSFKDQPLRVVVDNRSGAVTVVVREGAEPQVKLRAIDGPAGTRENPRKHGTTVIQTEGEKRSLSVTTTGASGPVHVWVLVPRCDGLEIRNADGPVSVDGGCGELVIRNDSTGKQSPITVRTGANLTGGVELRSGAGDVELSVGHASSGRLASSTPSGRTDLNTGGGTSKGVVVSKGQFGALLNGGESAWTVEATNGDVRVTLCAEPTEPVKLQDLWPW